VLFLQLLPAILSLLVLAAHFLRSGNSALVTVVLATGVLLAVPKVWAARVVQVVLVLGAIEWIRTLVSLASRRAQFGQPAGRMILILGGVALVTGLSALALRSARARTWYRRGGAS
jgi:hypothetical protein